MAGQRASGAYKITDLKRAGPLVDRLELMFEWYRGMVDQNTGRLLYLYDPENDLATGDGEPIRDIAAVWDVEVLSAFLGRDDLLELIRRSLANFDQWVIGRDGYAIVVPPGGSSSIAHSAFLALALARSDLPDKAQRLTPLADGILRQQRQDGSYKVHFDAAPDSGEELYPAEAMLALLEAYRLTRDARYLASVERGFGHYKRDYYDRGLVDPGRHGLLREVAVASGPTALRGHVEARGQRSRPRLSVRAPRPDHCKRLLRSRGAQAGKAGLRGGCLRARGACRCVRGQLLWGDRVRSCPHTRRMLEQIFLPRRGQVRQGDHPVTVAGASNSTTLVRLGSSARRSVSFASCPASSANTIRHSESARM